MTNFRSAMVAGRKRPRFALAAAAALCGAFTADDARAQQPPLRGSLDQLSPEISSGLRAGDVFVLGDPGHRVERPARELGVPALGNVDAISDGFDVFTAVGPASGEPSGRAVAGSFSVDRTSVGRGAVAAQSSGNGAASDVFGIVWLPDPQPPYLQADAPCLTPGRSDIDGLSREGGFPLYYSVDPQTAQVMSGSLNASIGPADILWIEAPGATPSIFRTSVELGLLDGDDIDALAVGPEGLLFSLTRSSPTATALPEIGGAGLFVNGPIPWATAEQCGLLDTDELNALVTRDPGHRGIEYLHTPLVPGRTTMFRVDGMLPGEQAFVLGSLNGMQPFCLLGLCLDIHPDFVLMVTPPADPLGRAICPMPIPMGLAGLDLATQALIPRGPVNQWQVSNPVPAQALFAWGWIGLTQGAATNGYIVDHPRFWRIRLRGVTLAGSALNGKYWVTATVVVDGQTKTIKKKIQFTNGNADLGTGYPQSRSFRVTKVGVSYEF